MKKVLVILAALVALLVIGFFVVTSSAFLRWAVVPRVGAALNARVEAGDISLRPFSRVELRSLRVTPTGAETLATAETALVRYDLWDILRGNITLHEIFASGVAITVVRKADGSSNLDPILRKLAEEEPGAAKPAEPGAPVRLHLAQLRIENSSLSVQSASADGSTFRGEITGLSATARDFRNGGSGRVEFGAGVAMEQRPGAGAAGQGRVRGQVNGAFDIGLTEDLLPGAMSGRAEARLNEATGIFEEFQGFSTVITADLTPTELRQFATQFARADTPLGSITAAGPLDMAKKEADLRVAIASIDRNVLNLAGAPLGIDFGNTRLDSTNRIRVANEGSRIEVEGQVVGSNVAVRQGTLTMPPVDLTETHAVVVDLSRESATLSQFALNGRQGGRQIVEGRLAAPMEIQWGGGTAAAPDAALEVRLTDLRLADWSALVGSPVQGTAQGTVTLRVQNGGADLLLEGNGGLQGVNGLFASNEVKNLSFTASGRALVAGYSDPSRRKLSAAVKVDQLTGDAGPASFNQHGLDATAEITLPEDAIQIDSIQASVRQAGQDGGRVTLRGRIAGEGGTTSLQFSTDGLNEAALRPFLQPALGDKELRRARLAATGQMEMQASGDLSVKTDAKLTDLVVRDPAGTIPETPLEAGFVLDAASANNTLNLRQAELRLTPTERADNVARLTGDLNFAQTNALSGALKLTAAALDLTRYFDLFAGAPEAAPQPSPTPTPPSQPAPGPQEEPAPIELPIGTLTAEAAIGKLFLRDIAAENIAATLKIVGSQVELSPFHARLNGAPVTAGARLNLGVPGYEYAIQASADAVPVRPLANSFVAAVKDRIEGTVDAAVDIRGAGVTGTSLQKSLAGGMQFGITNANLKLDTGSRGVMSILTGLLATALNIRELRDQPIMEIGADVGFGEGAIQLRHAAFRSASLGAQVQGAIPIADDLMQSRLELPVHLELSRDLARRARLVGADEATNLTYVPLPEIASLKGTLGEPKPDVDKVKTGLLVARGVGGLVGGAAGDTIQGVTGIIGGVAKGETNSVKNLIQGIGGLFGGSRTNAQATNAPGESVNPTNASPPKSEGRSPLGGLIRGILDGQKNEERP